ncbi:MAG TPA: DUF1028 domain-containing protein [Candidatus Binataceae bacterium]|nr:DUF1028 domain-containing protein [Candidatus Binataceae bacterium]
MLMRPNTDSLCHTYSIVARDAATGQLGVAVQSHHPAVGAVVTWAEAGVGAVATQALADPSYGKLGLDLMRAGKSAATALAGLLASDSNREIRQVAMVDARGGVAAHTGNLTVAEAGHWVGEGFSAQANMMLKNTVWSAMAKAYEAAEGDLAERMLAALDAAEQEGGDIRGRQSAAILIVAGQDSGRPWYDSVFNLRVDDASEPLVELRRLVGVRRAHIHLGAGNQAAMRGDASASEREYAAAERLVGNNPEMRFWHAIALLGLGNVDRGLGLLREIAQRDRNWITLALRLPEMFLANRSELEPRIRALLE